MLGLECRMWDSEILAAGAWSRRIAGFSDNGYGGGHCELSNIGSVVRTLCICWVLPPPQ